jgi:hypothetical protein
VLSLLQGDGGGSVQLSLLGGDGGGGVGRDEELQVVQCVLVGILRRPNV